MIKMKDCIPIGDTITTVEQLSNGMERINLS